MMHQIQLKVFRLLLIRRNALHEDVTGHRIGRSGASATSQALLFQASELLQPTPYCADTNAFELTQQVFRRLEFAVSGKMFSHCTSCGVGRSAQI